MADRTKDIGDERVDPTVEDAYWRANYRNRPYTAGETYERWRPAYQHGWQSCQKYRGRHFDEVEPEVRRDWERTDTARDLTWERARQASRDAWQRIETAGTSESVGQRAPSPADADRERR